MEEEYEKTGKTSKNRIFLLNPKTAPSNESDLICLPFPSLCLAFPLILHSKRKASVVVENVNQSGFQRMALTKTRQCQFN